MFLFFLYFFFETCIGGSGGLLKYDFITLRKVNFVLAILVMLYVIYMREKLDYETLRLTFIFIILLLTNTIIGIFNYGNDDRISENFLAESFFILLPFYPLFIKNTYHVRAVIKIFAWSSIIQAIAYLSLLVLIYLGVFNYIAVYDVLTQSGDFFGRGIFGFWYKGFIYMCLGIYFMDLIKSSFLKRLVQVIVLIALVFTLTRGFVAALFGTAIIYNFFFKSKIKSVAVVVIALVSIIALKGLFEDPSLNRGLSDNVRSVQVEEVMDAVTPLSFFIGHGLGKGVSIRQNHMEINYLEIFHKQGIIGVAFWIYLLIYIVLGYVNVRRVSPENEKIARPFFLATVFVYIESLTNPFLTNSIGLNVIMVSIVCLNVLKRRQSHEDIGSNGYLQWR